MRVRESTVLTCNHDNTGNLTYIWMKNGHQIDQRNSQLKIHNFTESDAGNYICGMVHEPLMSTRSEPIQIMFAREYNISHCHLGIFISLSFITFTKIFMNI